MKRRTVSIMMAAALFAGVLQAQDYRTLHRSAIVIDTHNDVLLRAMQGEDLSVRTTDGHSDLVRFREGGLDAEFFSVWCGENYGTGRAFRRANAMIDTLEALVRRNPDKIALARNAAQVEEAVHQGKIAALIGVEGGHMIEDDLSKIDSLARRGMKYLTLTWNNSTSWATSAADESHHADTLSHLGLNDFGRAVVRRLNDLGVMVDLSHVGERTFWDAIRTTSKPIIVSHSCAYALCPVSRNLKDDQIAAVAKNGGVICVNFYSGFLDSSYDRKAAALRRMNRSMIDSVDHLYSDHDRASTVVDSILAPSYRQIRPPLSLLIDHIDYMVRHAGIDHVGIGSDFDGVESVPQGMDDVTFLPNVTKALLERGYTAEQVRKILGGNVLRVLRANDAGQ